MGFEPMIRVFQTLSSPQEGSWSYGPLGSNSLSPLSASTG